MLTTPGREIENLVIPEQFHRIISEVRQKSIKVDKSCVDIEYDAVEMSTGDSFDKVYSAAARREDGVGLSDLQRRRIAENLSSKKVSIARKIVAGGLPSFTEDARAFGLEIGRLIGRVPEVS